MKELFWMALGALVATLFFNKTARDWLFAKIGLKKEEEHSCLDCRKYEVIKEQSYCDRGDKLVKIEPSKSGKGCRLFTASRQPRIVKPTKKSNPDSDSNSDSTSIRIDQAR